MNATKTIVVSCLHVALLLILSKPLLAATGGNPTLVLPNSATNDPYTFGTQRPVASGYYLRSMYYDKATDSDLWTDSGVVLTSNPGSLSWGIPNSNPNSTSDLYANPGTFDVKAKTRSWTDGSQNFHSYGSSQAWSWHVISGTPGPVTLSVDILVQGEVFANYATGGNAATIFSHKLGFLSSPSDLTQDYPIFFHGDVGYTEELAGYNTVTVPNTVTGATGAHVSWDKGEDVRSVNYILRSQPFTVDVGEPFRLSLLSTAEAFAGPGGTGDAWADFYDPRLVTSFDFGDVEGLTPDGFSVVSGEGQYSTLGSLGYSIAGVPEPSAVILFGAGLIAFFGLSLRRRR